MPSKRSLLKTILLCLAVGTAFALLAGGAASQTQYNPAALLKDLMPDPRVWKGTVKITRVGSQNFKEDRSRNGKTDTESTTRTVNDQIIIHACGVSGRLYVNQHIASTNAVPRPPARRPKAAILHLAAETNPGETPTNRAIGNG